MRKLWYAGAGLIAGGVLLFVAAPAQADVTSPKTAALPAADVVGGSVPDAPGDQSPSTLRLPFTDTNSGSPRLPVVGRLPIIGGLLPNGSRTLESASTTDPALDDRDGSLLRRLALPNSAGLAGLPLGGTPVPLLDDTTPAMNSQEPMDGAATGDNPAPTDSPAPVDSAAPMDSAAPVDSAEPAPYTSVAPARPGIAAPSAVAPVDPSAAVVPSTDIAPTVDAVPSADTAPSSTVDDPRMLEEPLDGTTN
ncbi:hypothetical protein [Actinoplanes palleronii]|uniref:Uncharacterized protein n=1 Tax=Actinoplanes palleronii TaxID=113570 RepID=A0ABQ4BJ41_9ACTN|nr:hypothetical protein [Actinoplanes palleronii]GIE70700.1 hypothetical protein Apa02nite_068080 [Actinoplanes palleronii]